MTNEKEEILEQFILDYNDLFNVPATKATKKICEQYRLEHPNEFKISDWSIEKHRKRFMDWMSRQRPEALKLLK